MYKFYFVLVISFCLQFNLFAQTKLKTDKHGVIYKKEYQNLLVTNQFQLISAFEKVSERSETQLAMFVKDGKYGLLNQNGVIITKQLYPYLQPFDISPNHHSSGSKSGFFKVSFNGKLGIINEKGEEVIPTEMSNISQLYSDSTFSFYKNKKENGLKKITATGDFITYTFPKTNGAPKYEEVAYDTEDFDDFEDEEYEPREEDRPFTVLTKYGKHKITFKRSGKVIFIPANRSIVDSYMDKWLVVKNSKGKKGIYSLALDSLIVATEYYKVEPHYFCFITSDNYGTVSVYDTMGVQVVPELKGYVSAFGGPKGSGIAVGKYDTLPSGKTDYKTKTITFFNQDFKQVTDYSYTGWTRLSTDFIIAEREGLATAFDINGKILVPFKYEKIQLLDEIGLTEPLIKVTLNKKVGIIDMKGKVVCKPIYEELAPEYDIDEGLTYSFSGSRLNYIDAFSYYNSPNKYYFFKKDDKYGILDSNFKVVLKNKYYALGKSDIEHHVYVMSDSFTKGIIDMRTKKIVLPAIYDRIEYSHNVGYYLTYAHNGKQFGLLDKDLKVIVPANRTKSFTYRTLYKGLNTGTTYSNKLLFFVNCFGEIVEVEE